MQAMMTCYQVEEPEKYARLLQNPRTVGASWSDMAKIWQWRARARAFDSLRNTESQKRLDEARTLLIEATVKAVHALIDSLENSKTRVSAAKEILDRGGLPGTIVRENRIVPFTADELAQAQKELADWETNFQLPSDSSG